MRVALLTRGAYSRAENGNEVLAYLAGIPSTERQVRPFLNADAESAKFVNPFQLNLTSRGIVGRKSRSSSTVRVPPILDALVSDVTSPPLRPTID